MDKNIAAEILDTTITRRDFLAGTAGLTFSFALGGVLVGRPSESLAAGPVKMNAWVTIGTDDTVTILTPGAEMGDRKSVV